MEHFVRNQNCKKRDDQGNLKDYKKQRGYTRQKKRCNIERQEK